MTVDITHLGGSVTAEHESLLVIANLIDDLCRSRANIDPIAAAFESTLRQELFALIDNPTQVTWERVRELELAPHTMPGLTTPSPLGITVGDIVYAFGLPDVECPDQQSLMQALDWACDQLPEVAPA